VSAWDRVKESFFSLVRASSPRAAYNGVYRGVVVSQSGQSVDLRLDDPRLPGMSGLPIQVGLPAATVEMAAGARMVVAFENGDPSKPIALLWEGAQARRISLPADLLELGGEGVADAVIKGTSYQLAEKLFLEALRTYALAIKPVADPPGLATAALNLAIAAFEQAPVLSTVVKTA
jgi:hypothetical protein